MQLSNESLSFDFFRTCRMYLGCIFQLAVPHDKSTKLKLKFSSTHGSPRAKAIIRFTLSIVCEIW